MPKKRAKSAAVDTASGVDARPSDPSDALRLASKAAERWPHICDTIVFFIRQASNATQASQLSLTDGVKQRAATDAKKYASSACEMLHKLDLQLTQHAPAIIGQASKLHAVSAGVVDAVGDHFASAHNAALSIAQSLFFDAWELVDPMRLMNAWGRESKQWAAVFEAVEEPEKLVELIAAGSKWCDFKSSDASRIRSLLLLERAKLWPPVDTTVNPPKITTKSTVGQSPSDNQKNNKLPRKNDDHSRECLKRFNKSERGINPQSIADIVDEYITEMAATGTKVSRSGTLKRISDNR